MLANLLLSLLLIFILVMMKIQKLNSSPDNNLRAVVDLAMNHTNTSNFLISKHFFVGYELPVVPGFDVKKHKAVHPKPAIIKIFNPYISRYQYLLAWACGTTRQGGLSVKAVKRFENNSSVTFDESFNVIVPAKYSAVFSQEDPRIFVINRYNKRNDINCSLPCYSNSRNSSIESVGNVNVSMRDSDRYSVSQFSHRDCDVHDNRHKHHTTTRVHMLFAGYYRPQGVRSLMFYSEGKFNHTSKQLEFGASIMLSYAEGANGKTPQKNWIMFEYHSELHFIQSIDPLRILKIGEIMSDVTPKEEEEKEPLSHPPPFLPAVSSTNQQQELSSSNNTSSSSARNNKLSDFSNGDGSGGDDRRSFSNERSLELPFNSNTTIDKSTPCADYPDSHRNCNNNNNNNNKNVDQSHASNNDKDDEADSYSDDVDDDDDDYDKEEIINHGYIMTSNVGIVHGEGWSGRKAKMITVSSMEKLPSIPWQGGPHSFGSSLRGGTNAVYLPERGVYLSIFHTSGHPLGGPDSNRAYFIGAVTFCGEPPFAVASMSSYPIIWDKALYEGAWGSNTRTSYVLFPTGIILEYEKDTDAKEQQEQQQKDEETEDGYHHQSSNDKTIASSSDNIIRSSCSGDSDSARGEQSTKNKDCATRNHAQQTDITTFENLFEASVERGEINTPPPVRPPNGTKRIKSGQQLQHQQHYHNRQYNGHHHHSAHDHSYSYKNHHLHHGSGHDVPELTETNKSQNQQQQQRDQTSSFSSSSSSSSSYLIVSMGYQDRDYYIVRLKVKELLESMSHVSDCASAATTS